MITPRKASGNTVCGPVPLWPEAERLYSLGLSLIPTVPGRKITPKGFRWKRYQTERADIAEVGSWFRDCDSQERGIGVVLGAASGGVLVRDFDAPGSYEGWAARHPKLAAELPTVRSPRGHGRHVYARVAEPVRSRKLADGELKSVGTIVVAPPSWGWSGLPYKWLIEPVGTIPTVPLADLLEGHPANPPEWGVHTRHVPVCTPDCLRADWPGLLAKHGVTGPGQRHFRIFALARALRRYLETAEQAVPYVREWWEAGQGKLRTGWGETLADLREGWDKIKFPGASGLQAAIAAAKAAPTPPEAEQFPGERARLLVAVCRELQRLNGDQPFFLGTRDAAAALGLRSNRRAWTLLNALVDAKVLERVDRGTEGVSVGGKAASFKYLGTL